MQNEKQKGGLTRPPPPLLPKPKLKTTAGSSEKVKMDRGTPVAMVKPMIQNKPSIVDVVQNKAKPQRPPPPLPKHPPVGSPAMRDQSKNEQSDNAPALHINLHPIPTSSSPPVPAGRSSPVPAKRTTSSGRNSPVQVPTPTPAPKPKPRVSKFAQPALAVSNDVDLVKEKEPNNARSASPVVDSPIGGSMRNASPSFKPRPVPRKRDENNLGETKAADSTTVNENMPSDDAVSTDSRNIDTGGETVDVIQRFNDIDTSNKVRESDSKKAHGNDSQSPAESSTRKEPNLEKKSSFKDNSKFSNILKMFSSPEAKESGSSADEGPSPSRPPRHKKNTKTGLSSSNSTPSFQGVVSKEDNPENHASKSTVNSPTVTTAKLNEIPPKIPILPPSFKNEKDTNSAQVEGGLGLPSPETSKRHSYEDHVSDIVRNKSLIAEDDRKCRRRSRSVGAVLDVINDGPLGIGSPRPNTGPQPDNPQVVNAQQQHAISNAEKDARKSDNSNSHVSILQRFSKKERTSSQSSVGSQKGERGRSDSKSQFFVETPLPKSRSGSACGSISSVEEVKEENKGGQPNEPSTGPLGVGLGKFSQAQHMLSQVMKARFGPPGGDTSQDKTVSKPPDGQSCKRVPARPAPPVPKKLPVLPTGGDFSASPVSPGGKRTTLERMQAEGLIRRRSLGDVSQTSSEHIYSFLDDDDYDLITKTRSNTSASEGSHLYEQIDRASNNPSSYKNAETSSVGSSEADEYVEPIKTRRASYEYIEPVVKAEPKPSGYEYVEPQMSSDPSSPPPFVAPPPPKSYKLKHSQSMQASNAVPARPPRRKRNTVEVGNVLPVDDQSRAQTAVPSIVVTQQSQEDVEGEEYFDMSGIRSKQDSLEGEEYFDMQGLNSKSTILEGNIEEEEYFDMQGLNPKSTIHEDENEEYFDMSATAYKKVSPLDGDSHQEVTEQEEEYFDMQGRKPLASFPSSAQADSTQSAGNQNFSCAKLTPPVPSSVLPPPPPAPHGHHTGVTKEYVNVPPMSPSAALITEDEYFDMSGVSRSPMTSDLSHDVSSDNDPELEDSEYSAMSVLRDGDEDGESYNGEYSEFRRESGSPTNSFTDSDSDFSSVGQHRPLSTLDEDDDPGEGVTGGGHVSKNVTMRLHPHELMRPDSHAESMYSENSDSSQNEGQPKRSKIFYIAKEMMTSEKVFVEVLKLLNIEFRNFVTDMTTELNRTVIPNPLLCQLLNYLPQLEDFNEDLLKDLTERVENWDEDPRIADIFVKKGPFLKLYTTYIREYEHTSKRFDEACKEYPLFADVVKKFEAKDCCASLNLKAFMLKPIQRIPQYRLLLNDYKKHLPKDSNDLKDTEVALEIVSAVADHANEAMRQGDQLQKMLEVQSNLVGGFEVIKPGRVLIKQGTLEKLSRKVMQPRMFFLFNDVLLYTTPTSTGSFRLNHVLPLTGMKVAQPAQDDFQNEFSIISVQRSITVSASTPDERDEWLKAMTKAISDVMSKKKSFDVQMLLKEGSYDKDFVLGSTAPVWIPDSRVSMCTLCTTEFTVTFRRHHCRACGKIVCSICSDNKAPLRYMDNKSARVCDVCYGRLEKEFGDVTKYIPATGEATEQEGQVSLHPSKVSLKERFSKSVRNSKWLGSRKSRPSVLQEVHANDQGSEMSGYLKVWRAKKWKKLWFVIKDKVLYTYKASEDMAAVESTPLLGYDVVKATEYCEGVEPSLIFTITHQGRQPMVFRTEAPSARDKWVSVLTEATMP